MKLRLIDLAALFGTATALAAACSSSSSSGGCHTDADCTGASLCDLSTNTCTNPGSGSSTGSFSTGSFATSATTTDAATTGTGLGGQMSTTGTFATTGMGGVGGNMVITGAGGSGGGVSTTTGAGGSGGGGGGACVAHGQPCACNQSCCNAGDTCDPTANDGMAQICCSENTCTVPKDCCNDDGMTTCLMGNCSDCLTTGLPCQQATDCCNGACTNQMCN
jgi:hypothetical protein